MNIFQKLWKGKFSFFAKKKSFFIFVLSPTTALKNREGKHQKFKDIIVTSTKLHLIRVVDYMPVAASQRSGGNIIGWSMLKLYKRIIWFRVIDKAYELKWKSDHWGWLCLEKSNSIIIFLNYGVIQTLRRNNKSFVRISQVICEIIVADNAPECARVTR